MGAKGTVLAAALMLVQIAQVFGLPNTSPAFLWTPHDYGLSYDGAKDIVKYQTLSPDALANSVLNEAGWSEFICSGNGNGKVDLALVFIGRKLRSSDISKTNHQDPLLTNTLKSSFTSSNFSMAFPYVDTSNEDETLESSIIKGFSDKCGQDFSEKVLKLTDLNSIQEHVSSKTEKKSELIVYSHEGSEELKGGKSEGEILSGIVGTLDKSGARYTILYISEPYQFDRYQRTRFLAEATLSNSSSNSTTCDDVCKIKASLLEGLLVGITLLIILISGLCCMMGIDSPSRFETAQE